MAPRRVSVESRSGWALCLALVSVILTLACPPSRSLAATAPPSAACDALAGRVVDGAQITAATLEPAGSASINGQTQTGLPAFCRVVAVIDTTVHFEDWLPANTWNSDLETVGNGGYAGLLDYGDMGVAVGQ